MAARTLCRHQSHYDGQKAWSPSGGVDPSRAASRNTPGDNPQGKWRQRRCRGRVQVRSQSALAKRHLQNGTLVLYVVSSRYLEGRCCPLAQRGYNRDGKKGMLQIVYGLLCAPDGCPVAIEVFAGNTGDPAPLGPPIDKLKQRFGLEHVVLVDDRGMITEARISADIKSPGLDWISAVRGPAIKALLNSGTIRLTLFDTRDMAAITSPDLPGERLVGCRNPDLAAERTRKR